MILTKSTVNIRKVIKTSMDVISPLITQKKGQVTCDAKFSNDVPELILADELRLKQVLLNLLSNAIKFTQRGTIAVSCSITWAEKLAKTMNKDRMFINPANSDKKYLKLEIEDSGRGISPDEVELIFSAFEQVRTYPYMAMHLTSGFSETIF
jgi:signal transduction histidine kinase